MKFIKRSCRWTVFFLFLITLPIFAFLIWMADDDLRYSDCVGYLYRGLINDMRR